jgi:hypothetical protein
MGRILFVGGPLDGKEHEIPEQFGNNIRIPWQDFYPGHPDYRTGYYWYVFDGLAWRYNRTEES